MITHTLVRPGSRRCRPRRSARMTSPFRVEHDSMGEIQVPADALWGAQTQRALQNFRISGRPMPRAFIAALGLVKQAAARANRALGLLDSAAERAASTVRGVPVPRTTASVVSVPAPLIERLRLAAGAPLAAPDPNSAEATAAAFGWFSEMELAASFASSGISSVPSAPTLWCPADTPWD